MFAFALINLHAQQGPPAQVPALPSTQPAAASATCRVTGSVTSAGIPLPGVAITIKAGPTLRAATSTELGGAFSVPLGPGEYTLTADLTGFTRAEQTVSVLAAPSGPTCGHSLNISMPLAPRTPLPAPAPAAAATGAATSAANTGTT
ncbi:MAG: carboxypeptidase-like regulatory domain-containing protein, partial [Vicinamibacterales bacterium]